MSKKIKEKIMLLGQVGVDSGQIVISDPCYIDSEWKKDVEYDQGKKGEYSYGGACKTCDSKNLGGQLNYKRGHAGAGVALRTGYGDGMYPVYGVYNDEGRITKVLVDFEGMPGEAGRKIFDILTKAKSVMPSSL